MQDFQLDIIKANNDQILSLAANTDDYELFKSWSSDLQKQFPSGGWRTINGAHVFINNGKIITGLEGFNGKIDEFFSKKEAESKPVKENFKNSLSNLTPEEKREIMSNGVFGSYVNNDTANKHWDKDFKPNSNKKINFKYTNNDLRFAERHNIPLKIEYHVGDDIDFIINDKQYESLSGKIIGFGGENKIFIKNKSGNIKAVPLANNIQNKSREKEVVENYKNSTFGKIENMLNKYGIIDYGFSSELIENPKKSELLLGKIDLTEKAENRKVDKHEIKNLFLYDEGDSLGEFIESKVKYSKQVIENANEKIDRYKKEKKTKHNEQMIEMESKRLAEETEIMNNYLKIK